MTSKCCKNKKVAHEAIAECVADVLTTASKPCQSAQTIYKLYIYIYIYIYQTIYIYIFFFFFFFFKRKKGRNSISRHACFVNRFTLQGFQLCINYNVLSRLYNVRRDKARYANHKASFKARAKSNSTELSKYITPEE